MIAKTQFTKDQIVDAAFEIACQEGLDAITVRRVAERIGSSIAPIYVNFKSIEDLVQAVVEKTVDLSQALLGESGSGSPFYDLGEASLRFAREYPQLFRDLALKPNRYMEKYNEQMGPVLLDQMKKDPELEGFSDQQLLEILLKMRIFQLGLSAMIANRLLPESFDETQAQQLLHSAAGDVITAARLHK